MVKEKLVRKLKQASFHFQKMGESRKKDDQFAVECYFSAYLALLRSVVFYIETWMKQSGKTRNKKEWLARIKKWEKNTLSSDQLKKWRCITRSRNKDIHVEPIIPEIGSGGYWHNNYWPRGYWAKEYWPNFREFTITDPSKQVYDLFDVCQTSIDVAQKLINEYSTI